MRKQSAACLLFLTMLLLASPTVWAQGRFLRPFSHQRTVTRSILARQTSPLRKIPYQAFSGYQIFIPAISERELNVRLNRIVAYQKIIQQKEQAPVVTPTIVVIPETQINVGISTPIIFRGVQIGTLEESESIMLGSAYDSKGFEVVSLPISLPNGQPVPLDHLERGLPGYDIKHVVLMIRTPSTGNKKLRFIDYNLETGQITTPTFEKN